MSVLLRSIKLAAIATILCIIIAYPLAYILSRKQGFQKQTLFVMVMLPMWMNFLLRTYAWMSLLEHNGIINRFLGLLGVGPFNMINTSGAVVLGMVYNYLPYMVLPLYTIMVKIDNSVIEAAQDLGANVYHVVAKVLVPLSMPGITTGITMVFVPSVSTFAISRLLGGKDETDCAEAVERFLKSIDLNCKLRELGVEESGIDWMTDNCINVFAGSMRNHTKALTRDEVKQIYLEAF